MKTKSRANSSRTLKLFQAAGDEAPESPTWRSDAESVGRIQQRLVRE
jgi:hypothetical protein